MKRLTSVLAALLAALLLLSSCGASDVVEESTTETTSASTTTETTTVTTTETPIETTFPESDPYNIRIIYEATTEYSVVLPADSLTKLGGSGMVADPVTGKLSKMSTTVDTPVAVATKALIAVLAEKTGVTIPMTDDKTATGEHEILIGLTNRPESIALHKTLKERSFAVQTTENKLVIVGYDDHMTATAVQYCLEEFIIGGEIAGQEIETGLFTVPVNMAKTSPQYPKTPDNTIRIGGTYTMSKATEFVSIEADGDFKVMQGGCTDGTYLYYCIENQRLPEGAHESYIYKVSLETGKVVAKSKGLQLDHSNDMTYNSKLNQLLVVHNAPNRRLVSRVDADTLEKLETIDIGREIFSMAYNETRDQYVVGNSGGQTFTILDHEFKRIREYIPVPSTGYTTQGMTCDDRYIYFVQAWENVVVVYDWDGYQVCIIPVEFSAMETENISLVGNDFYIGFYRSNNGGVVYRTEITVKK